MTCAIRRSALALLLVAAPAWARNRLVHAGQPIAVAHSTLTVIPEQEWNALAWTPGGRCDRWTHDGEGLNAVTFCGAIESGRPLFRDVAKRDRPLPHFSTTMLLTDIPALMEASYHIARGATLMTIDATEPARLGDERAIRFHYSYGCDNDDLERFGEAIAAIHGKKLYLLSFEAPAIHYFGRDRDLWCRLAASARFR